MIFHCGACQKPKEKNGAGLRSILGVKTWVCLGCRTAADMASGRMKKCTRNPKRRFVGSDGKMVRAPEGKQAKFTVGGGIVHASKVKGYPGCDIRYSLTEKEAKKFVGAFGSLRIGEYPSE
jgi:hypothetical protein